MVLRKIYDRLLKEYGEQGWWPIISYNGNNSTKTGSINGYHPGEYDFPRNDEERFEIICGALLTQNTSWLNVEKALTNLRDVGLLGAKEILEEDSEKIKECIKPAGYYNSKAERLKILAEFFIGLKGRVPRRDELLLVKGVGPETCDSILLYAYSISSFVVDTYTRRIIEGLGVVESGLGYDEIKDFFEKNLEEDYKIYQEFHALFVEHAKRFYIGKKNGENDFLKEVIDSFF